MAKVLSRKLKEKIERLSEDIIKKDELEARMKSGKKLRIKYGVDVTSPFLHLGHAVNLWLMRAFQEEGHKVVFLVGDFTTKIGDPTGKSEARPRISDADIKNGAKEFVDQASKILLTDKRVFEKRKNSEWYGKMDAARLVELMSLVTNARLIERDMFQKRLQKGGEVFEHEIIYPLLQGYDSVMLKSDLTIIGSDQLFNEMMGRTLQEKFGQGPQVIITTKITPGIKGREKQSKSLGNYIGLLDSAREKFGKIMSIPDNLIVQYFEIYSDTPISRVKEVGDQIKKGILNPKDAKMELAESILSKYHEKKEMADAKKFFINTFQKKELPENVKEVHVAENARISDVLVKNNFSSSKSGAARLIKGGAVEINGRRIKDIREKITEGGILKVGKKRFLRIALK